MKWNRYGLIYAPSGANGFDASHCHKPTPILLDSEIVRVYFGVRDSTRKTRTTFIDLDPDDLKRIIHIHEKPVIDLGKIGAFDDSGANVCSVVRHEGLIYMYFIGWNPSTTVHTRNSIGLAVSEDNGITFRRLYDGPILDRNKDEPYYTGAVDVIVSNGKWEMWYTSGSAWKIINGKPEIWYHIKYAHSVNGIDWIRDNNLCIPPSNEFEATARPSVIKENGKYKMWYSRRNIINFRTDPKSDYRGGYAESKDGLDWVRMDSQFGLSPSGEGWDSDSIAYPYVIDIHGRRVMFYNGNGFGATGFGYAELES